jgi:hypothetical protein
MPPSDSSSAQINLNVTSFVANSSNPPNGAPSGPFCTIDSPLLVRDADGSVSIDADDRTLIRVNRGRHGNSPVTLTFTIGPGTAFTPKQIVFVQSNGGGDSDGATNFRDRNPSDQTISVRNHWVHRGRRRGAGGRNEAPRWKYFIRVQNSAGAFGWIDPGVENSEQE